MKQIKPWKILLICLLLVLTNNASVCQNPMQQYVVDTQSIPVGSVPVIAETTCITYVPDYPIHFIGDSRTVGLKQSLSDYGYNLSNHFFTAKIGQGYSWFSSQQSLTELPPSILVINLGVNDLGNISHYQTLYESYAQTCWKDCPIYIVSVNPCCAPCTSVSNYQIEAFNTAMQQWIHDYNEENASASTETFPIRYIDTYHFLLEEGYSTSDGLHYSAATYERIYSYIVDNIQESIGDGSGRYSYRVSS